MCYMEPVGAEETVGVRELRQNLSVYLARVSRGTVFRVTERGKAIALLVPLAPHATTAARLVAAGRATSARHALRATGRPVSTAVSLSQALREVRDDRL
jgi:prevent-host-death family protein